MSALGYAENPDQSKREANDSPTRAPQSNNRDRAIALHAKSAPRVADHRSLPFRSQVSEFQTTPKIHALPETSRPLLWREPDRTKIRQRRGPRAQADNAATPASPPAGRGGAAVPPHPGQRGWARETACARTTARFFSSQSPARSSSAFAERAQKSSRRGTRGVLWP